MQSVAQKGLLTSALLVVLESVVQLLIDLAIITSSDDLAQTFMQQSVDPFSSITPSLNASQTVQWQLDLITSALPSAGWPDAS